MAIDWSSIGTGAVSGLAAGSALGPWGAAAGALVGGIGGFFKSDYEKQTQVDAENRQEQNQIESEQRANAEYDRRMADERAYNDPSAQAQRMRDAGINPMANLGQGVTSSSTKMSAPTQSSAPAGVGQRSTGPLGVSEGLQLMTMAEQAKRAKLENEMLSEQIKTERIEQIGKMTDNELAQFMLTFKKDEAPLLLEGLKRKNNNLLAEYDKIRSDETVNYQRLVEMESQITLNTANYFLVQAKEDGEIANTAYKKALTANEKANHKVIKARLEELSIKIDTDKSIFEALYESGYFKEKTEYEVKQAKTLSEKMQSEYENWKAVWGTHGGEDIYNSWWSRFVYLLTELI